MPSRYSCGVVVITRLISDCESSACSISMFFSVCSLLYSYARLSMRSRTSPFCTTLFSDTRTSRTSPFTFDTISTLSPEWMVPLSVYQSVTAPRLTRVLSTFRRLPMSSW